jgi:hypothetical protein
LCCDIISRLKGNVGAPIAQVAERGTHAIGGFDLLHHPVGIQGLGRCAVQRGCQVQIAAREDQQERHREDQQP